MNRYALAVLVVLPVTALLVLGTGHYEADQKDLDTPKTLGVVLSFDYEDLRPGAGTENLPAIFDLLEDHDADATFFVVGVTAQRDPEGVKEISDRGYGIGMHTYFHNFPIFQEEDTLLVSDLYGSDPERIWLRSFKTPENFRADLERTRAMLGDRTGSEANMFRSPSQVVHWTRDPVFFETLAETGVEIDSSYYQDWDDPRPYYDIQGITEVPVTASEKRLDDMDRLMNMTEDCYRYGVPLVLYMHPQEMDRERLADLDGFLNYLELNYNVTYMKIEEIPKNY